MTIEFSLHPDLQRDGILIADLPLCRLLMCNDKQYPWFIMVPRRADISELYQLGWEDQLQFLNESSALSELLMQAFNGDKMNVAALGNMTPQLHVHHVVRFNTDPSWPKPIWGQLPLQPYTDEEVTAIKAKLAPALKSVFDV